MKIYVFPLIALFAATIICKAEQRHYYNEVDTCYLETDSRTGLYAVYKKGDESLRVSDLVEIIMLSRGYVDFSHDTLRCIEKNSHKIHLFQVVNEYVVKPIQTSYFKENLYLCWIKRDGNTVESLSWKDGKLDGWTHKIDPAGGIKFIQYKAGVPIDSTFMLAAEEKPVWQAFPSPSKQR